MDRPARKARRRALSRKEIESTRFKSLSWFEKATRLTKWWAAGIAAEKERKHRAILAPKPITITERLARPRR